MATASKKKSSALAKSADAELERKLTQFTNQELELNKDASNVTGYAPGKKDRAIRRRVYQRYYEMADDPNRKAAEQDWEVGDKEFNMYVEEVDEEFTEDDWRSKLHLPDAFAAIQAQMQETVERKSRPMLKQTEVSDEPIADFANSVFNYNMNNTDYDYEYYLGKLNAAIRGTSFFKVYWRRDKRIVKDPYDIDEDTGELKYRDKEITDIDDSYMEWKANEYIYVDEKAKRIDDAQDMVEVEVLAVNEFKRIYGSKPGFRNTEFVRPCKDLNVNAKSFFRMPEDVMENDVEIAHYYNRSIDAYWVCANNVVIHSGPLQTKHKELPLAVLYHYQVPGRFWGMGIPKVIHHLSEERRSIRNLNMDRQKMQINKMFIHNNAFDIDDEDLETRPHGVISVDTNGLPLDQVIRPLEYGDVPPSYFRTEEILLEDIRRAHGIDDRIQGVQTGSTATEAAILKESSLKRVNLISITAEMKTVIRIGRLKWSDISFMYPIPRMERIYEDNKERDKKVYKRISVDGKKFSIEKGENGPQLKMEEIKGASALEIKSGEAKYLQSSLDIFVDSTVFAPVSKAIQQSKLTELTSVLLSRPESLAIVDLQKTYSRLLRVHDEKPSDWLKGDGITDADWQELADQENMIMAAGQPLGPTKDAPISHTQVHIWYAKSVEFSQLPEERQQLIISHFMAEHDANPATGSALAAMQGAGLAPPAPGQPGGAGSEAPGAPLNVPPLALSPNAQGTPQNQVADLQPTNFAAPE